MAKPIKPSIVDIEASGFGPDSYPIEIGVVLDNGEKYCSLILPDETWTHWNEEAESIHHVSREILSAHGKPMKEVANELNKILKNKTVYSDGWVVDKPWLSKLFYACKIQQLFHISALEMILSEPQMAIWHKTKIKVIQELGLQRHRASVDAMIIQETYIRSAKDAINNS